MAVTSRAIEALHTAGLNNLARSGSRAKTSSAPVAITPGMVHVKDGTVNAGISATAVAAALAGGALPTDPPTIGKVLTPVTISPGMRSRTTPTNDEQHRALGAAVLAESGR
jgi:ribonuclease PH